MFQAYLGEGQSLTALGRHEEALELAREATAIAGPSTAPGLSFRLQEAEALQALGQHQEALGTCHGIIETYGEVSDRQEPGYDHSFPLQSRAANAMVLKADVLLGLGSRDEAIAIYERAAARFGYAHAESFSESDDASREWAAQASEKLARLRADPPA